MKDQTDFFGALAASIAQHGERIAFIIRGQHHTYAELAVELSAQRSALRTSLPAEERVVALLANDDLRTYASILALWSEGKAYVPIMPEAPVERNERILQQAGVATLLSSTEQSRFPQVRTIRTDLLPGADTDLAFRRGDTTDLAYLLFTSGTTGQPKGVPITRGNVQAFVEAFHALTIPIAPGDRCLQMFDLTFDLSVMSYLLPLLHGGCVCTVPKDVVKYAHIAELLEEQRISVALLVPSIINYLRPYFEEIDLPYLRYSLFCGEALPLDITTEWARCVPHARIINVYGPTEHTIFCTSYEYQRNGANKAHNGILSIGRAMVGSTLVIVDEDQRILAPGDKGELCLSGAQLTPGYWNDAERTATVMFAASLGDETTLFYRTGDICSLDADGDFLYTGRTDNQTKIQGYRVELGEIEHQARTFLQKHNVVALAVRNDIGNNEVALVIEGSVSDTRPLLDHLRSRLPAYMVPTRLAQVPAFPLNANGKTDRNALSATLTFASP